MKGENTYTNFHTHTMLCKHATGLPADYLKVALETGCTALGFSDHCPYPDNHPETWSHIRMSYSEAPSYVKMVRDLQSANMGNSAQASCGAQGSRDAQGSRNAQVLEANASASTRKIPIYLGFECEFDPCFESWYRDTLKGELGADYLVFGPHWIKNGSEFAYIPDVTDKKLTHKYFDNIIKGLQTGLFAFLAHPDLIMGHGTSWSNDLEACFKSLIDAAISYNIPLEINGLGLARELVNDKGVMRHPYPVDNFWKLVKEKGARVICNADAHNPKDVYTDSQSSREYAKAFDFTLVENPLI